MDIPGTYILKVTPKNENEDTIKRKAYIKLGKKELVEMVIEAHNVIYEIVKTGVHPIFKKEK